MRTPIPDIAYIALSSRDPGRTRTFLGEDLALPHFTLTAPPPGPPAIDAFRVGQTALVVFPEGHPFLTSPKAGVDHLAIATGDPLKSRDATGLAAHALATQGLDGTPQTALAAATTCGVEIRFTSRLALPDATSERVERIDHLGIASADNAAAETLFTAKFGAVYESRQTDMEVKTAVESFTSDKYGVIYHARKPEAVGGLRVSFLTLGDLELEFLQNFDPAQGFERTGTAAGTTKQDQSAIGRFVAARGGGLHHVAFKVSDIDATLDHLRVAGHRLIDPLGRPGSRRARIGFLHPSSTGGILFHFVERTEIA